jgi:hypothetical protein
MDDRSTFRGPAHGDWLEFLKPHAAMAVLTVLTAVPIIVALAFVPRPVVLPALSLAMIVLAGLAASVAWLCGARQHGDGITLWDISGAFGVIGCAAAMLSKPENVLQVFSHAVVP